MNFGKLKRLRFGQRPSPESDVPEPHVARRLARRQSLLAEAAAIVPLLPAPGEALHAVMTGRYDLMALLLVILGQLPTVRHLRIATLAFSKANVHDLQALMDAGKVERLTILCSAFFRAQNRAEYRLGHMLCQRLGCRLAASRNHCKVVCLDHAEGTLVTEGSANLRTNGNQEQIMLVNDRPLHDWHAAWIDREVERHAAQEADEED